MKQILILLTLGTTTLFSSMGSFAAPPSHVHHPLPPEQIDDNDHNHIREQHRIREERGVKRLKQHRWQAGYVMPQHYRGNGYKIDYKDNHLPKPKQHQQWYKINNDYILVDSTNHNIVRILDF